MIKNNQQGFQTNFGLRVIFGLLLTFVKTIIHSKHINFKNKNVNEIFFYSFPALNNSMLENTPEINLVDV